MKYLIILLFSITTFSQSKPIELKIDAIKTVDNDDHSRKFTLRYHITNLTEKPIAFVLDTTHIVPIGGGSLRPNPYYKVFENETSIDVNWIFTNQLSRVFKDEAELNRYRDSLMNYVESRTPEQLSQSRKEGFLENIQKLAPKETKHFTTVLSWNKERYHKNDVIEYYISEKEKHFFELHINLMTEELLSHFTEEEKKEVLKDKVLTKGWFTSNKVEIDLSE